MRQYIAEIVGRKVTYNAAKTYVSNATTAVVNKVTGAVNTVVNYAKSAAQTVYNAAVNTYNSTKALYQEAKETVVNYVDKAKTAVATFAHDAWEGTKDVIEEGLQAAITGRQLVAQGLQEAGEWWSNTSVSKNLTKAAEAASSAWHNSAIGKSVTAISQSIDKAATAAKEKFENSSIGQFCSKVANSVTSFYEKHKTAINIIVGVAVIALCAVATVATAGGCGIAFAMASGALKGALIGAATGAVGGGMKSAMDYYEEHGTVDGSGSQILSGSAQGFAAGAAAGAASGAMAGVGNYHKNPSGYCFIAGTLVLTAVGLTNIENIQPGDLVFAKEAVGIEQSVDVNQDSELAPVLEVYSHEVYETYVVTVDGESIETTANHPFYDENGEQVEAKDLEEGDELTTANGDTATVDSVECIHHDEPVMVYNFCVMEDHTYFVGECGVLVHNDCNNSLAKKINNAKEKISEKNTGNTASRRANFASDELLNSHFNKHGSEFKGAFNSPEDYLQGARDTMEKGYRVKYNYKGEKRYGYIEFFGNNSKGQAKFAFVGTNNDGFITTFHTESGKSFWKMINGINMPVINPE